MAYFLERLLWSSRLAVMVAVVASILLAAGALFIATVDAIHVLAKLGTYAGTDLSDKQLAAIRVSLVTGIVKAVDGYLLGAIVLIFALGLYELFIGKLAIIENSEIASRLLLIRSLDDLKDRLAKVVLLILIIEFFQLALEQHYTTPLDLLYLAIGILLIGAAVYLSGRHAPEAKPELDSAG